MSIPQNITQEHLLQAIAYIQKHGVQHLDDQQNIVFLSPENNYANGEKEITLIKWGSIRKKRIYNVK